MRKNALVQAVGRLSKAYSAVNRMQLAKDYAALEEAWSDFLMAAGGVYSKLEQGAKGCGASEGWFGRKKHDRKTDELLSYLHHARNADEHGIEPTTNHQQRVGIGGNGYVRRLVMEGSKVIEFDADPGIHVVVEDFAALVPAHDRRYGDSFNPPTQHLGQPIPDTSPIGVARLGLAYLEGLISEGGQLPERP